MPVVIAVTLLLLMSLPASAGAPRTSEQWMTAVPPRAGLPAVDVSIGYPGGYVPRGYVPIALRARATDRLFDGTIGFRFVVPKKMSFDSTPVVSRVRLRPGELWSFNTWAHIGQGDQQLEVEWRDSALQVIAAVRLAALPAHPRRVLRVDGVEAAAKPARTLGHETYILKMSDLEGEAQWYSAFNAIVLPTAAWLDLPAAIREAIFGSGVFVVFIGTPRPEQAIGAKDQALLPVSFQSRPGSYTIPWPYRSAIRAPVATSMSWRPVAGASIVGRDGAPYIVFTGLGSAAWVAGESALDWPLPALEVTSNARSRYVFPTPAARPAIRQLLRSYVPMIITIIVVALVFVLWLHSRRTPRLAAMAGAVVVSGIVIAADHRIRPVPDRHDIDVVTPLSAGLVDHYRARYTAGPRPLDEEARPSDLVQTSISGVVEMHGRMVEIRTSNTPPGAGTSYGYSGDYEAILRWSSRREVGTPPNIRILSHGAGKLTLEYDSPEPVDEIFVAWSDGGRRFAGGTTQNGKRRGVATILDDRMPWPEGAWFSGTPWRRYALVALNGFAMAPARRIGDRNGIHVSLIHRTRTRTKELRWWQPMVSPAANEPLRISGTLRPASAPNMLSGLFVLPSRLPGGAAFVSLPTRLQIAGVTLTWSSGSAVAPAPTGDGAAMATNAFPIPPAVLQQILDSGGVFEVTARGNGPLPEETSGAIELWGKS